MLRNVPIATDHMFLSFKVYPSMGDGIQVTSSNSAWTLGQKQQVIPLGHITKEFDIHYVTIEVFSDSVGELILYKGAVGNETEISRIRVCGKGQYRIEQDKLEAGTRISAAIATTKVTTEYVKLSIAYHEY